MAFRGDEDEWVFEQRTADDVAVCERQADDDEIEVAGLELRDEIVGEVFGEENLDVGKLAREVRQAWRDEVRQHSGDDADAEWAAGVGFEVTDFGGGALGFVQDALGGREECSARVGEAHCPALTCEELCAEGLFKAADLLREGRLGDALLLGGFGEAAGVGDGAEVA